MWVLIITSFVALGLTYLESRERLKNGMALGFILVTAVAAIHYDYGNDYMSYYEFYDQCGAYSFNEIISNDKQYLGMEMGWVLLNYVFQYLGGFFSLIAVLSILQGVVFFNAIKNNVEKSWWPLAVFTYLFNFSFYALSFSMLRQSLVMTLFVMMWPLIRDRRWLPCLGIYVVCVLIHSSAAIMLLGIFVGLLPMKNIKAWSVSLLFFLALTLVSSGVRETIYSALLQIEIFEEYDRNYNVSSYQNTYGLGYVLILLPFLLSLFYAFKGRFDRQTKQLSLVYYLSFLIVPFGMEIYMLPRASLIFSIYSVLTVPVIYKQVKNTLTRAGFIFLYVFIYGYMYWGAFFGKNSVYAEPYETFHTIFSAT